MPSRTINLPRHPRLAAFALALGCLGTALPAWAQWALEPSRSYAGVEITELAEGGEIPHEHRLRQLSGEIADDGTLSVPLRARQLDIWERMEPLPPWLGGLADKPLATLETSIDVAALEALPVGGTLDATQTVRAKGREAPVALRFIRLDANTLRVTQAEPLSLDSREVRDDPVGASLLALLGYGEVKREMPVTFEAFLSRRGE